MHTPEQAKELWCPHARVAQIGAIETSATYNRALAKNHIPIKLAPREENGEPGETENVTAAVLKTEVQLSGAAMCIADKCAAWRWAVTYGPPLDAEPGKFVTNVAHRSNSGFCGLSGVPSI